MDTGDTAWVLASAALVLLMTPGLALFYGGMVRAKSVLNMMMMSFGALALISVLWVLYGYSMAFGNDAGGGLIGDPFEFFGLDGLMGTEGIDKGFAASSLVFTIPSMAFVAFQAVFAIITVALISGAIADRAKFGPWLLFSGIWATIVYFPVAHWVFAFDGAESEKGGWIANQLLAIDFAGGTAVHINAGAAGEVDREQLVGDPATRLRLGSVEREDPVGDGEVDDRGPDPGEDHPGAELGPVRDGTGDQRDGDDGEHRLEGDEGHGRDGEDQAGGSEALVDALGAHQALEPEELERVTEQPPADVVAERHRVAVEHPQDADQGECAEAHHHHVEDALGADHAAVEECESWCHQQHQRR